MIEYKLHEFIVSPRPLPTPWGGVAAAADYPFRDGATLKQWANIELAMAHVAAATKMLAEMDPELDAVPNLTDPRANRRQARLQFGFLVALAKHVARAYNALGLLWYNDPNHRVIYRKYLSGAPYANEGNPRDLYLKSKSWGGAVRWYIPNEAFPIVPTSGTDAMGVLPKQTREMLNEFYRPAFGLFDTGKTHKIQFVQQFSFVVSPQDSEMRDEETQKNVYNAGSLQNGTLFSWDTGLFECVNVMGEPWSTDDQTRDEGRCFMRTFDNRVMAMNVGPVLKGTRLDTDSTFQRADGIAPDQRFQDWRAFSYDVNRNAGDARVPLRVAPPLRAYLPYLAEVVASLSSRHPYEVIQDSRAFPVYNNRKTVQFNGTPSQVIADAIRTQGDLRLQQDAGSPELRAAGDVTNTLLTSVGPLIPFPGNLVTMIVGFGAGFIMKAINGTLIKGRISNHGRDDLGRYKIILDPQVLYRDVAATTAPPFPDSDDSVPTGYTEGPTETGSLRDILRYRDFQAFKSWNENKFGITAALTSQALANAIRFNYALNNRRPDSEGMGAGTIMLGLAAAGLIYYAMTQGPSPQSKALPSGKTPKKARKSARRRR